MPKYRSYSKQRSSFTPRSLRVKDKKTKKRLIWNIIIAVVLLYIVFSWVLPGLIGGLSFLNRFKSTPTQGANVSSNPTLAPPVLNIPYDATNSATIQISGYASADSQVQIYVDDNLKTTAKAGDDGSFQSDSIALDLGTNNIYGKTVDSTGTQSLASKPIQLVYSNDQPKLDVSSPGDNTQIHGGDKKVTVSGDTDTNNTVSINGVTAIVDSSGNFSTSVPINDGDNNVVITATNSVGNTTTVTRKVTYSAS